MKTSTYSWRVTDERKSALEALAHKQRRSVSELLDEAVSRWIEQQSVDDASAEELLRKAAAGAIGRIAGGDPKRAEESSARARAALRRKRVESR